MLLIDPRMKWKGGGREQMLEGTNGGAAHAQHCRVL